MHFPTVRDTFLALLLASLLAGCAQNQPYHDLSGEFGHCIDAGPDDNCRKSYYQTHQDFDLAFVEYSERGNAFNDLYRNEVLNRISSAAASEGVVLITFIHGWKHNASEGDSNLIDFKKSLSAVRKLLSSRSDSRRVVGLYVGWRGASIEWDWLQNVTFWNRKAVAEQVGKGGITRLMLDLDNVTRAQARNGRENAMVIIGHSFGGAIVISALSEILTERSLNGAKRTLGDGVIVLNPAIEATQILHLVESALRKDYPSDQSPLFISLSSDDDSATHKLFPAGQTIGLLATWRQADLKRSFYRDRETPDAENILREEHLDSTTAGNFAPYLTHRLTAKDNNGKVVFDFHRCDRDRESWDGCKPRGWTRLSGYPTFLPLPENYPLYFIKTDSSVIPDHNCIFNPRVQLVLTAVLDDVIIKKSADRRQRRTSILNIPRHSSNTPGASSAYTREALEDRLSQLQMLLSERGATPHENPSFGIDCSRVD